MPLLWYTWKVYLDWISRDKLSSKRHLSESNSVLEMFAHNVIGKPLNDFLEPMSSDLFKEGLQQV